MSEVPVRYDGMQEIRECWHCGNELLFTYKSWGNCWQGQACEICTKQDSIHLLKRQLYLDLRNYKHTENGWVIKKPYNVEEIDKRIRRTMWFACHRLGYDLATAILIKCTKDYWNEVKGYWVHSHQSGVACQPPRSLQSP